MSERGLEEALHEEAGSPLEPYEDADAVEVDADVEADGGYQQYDAIDADDEGYEVVDAGLDHGDLEPPPEPVPLLRREHVVGSVLLARLATWGLWLLVVGAVAMSALALLLRAASADVDDDPQPVTADDNADDAVLASGFAEMAVRRYLGEAGESTEDTVSDLIADGAPDLRGVTPAGFYVLDTAAVAVEERADGYWAVTVAADLMAAVDEQYQPVGLRYYGVGVLTGDADRGPVLADVPSQVPAPEAAESPGLLADDLSSADDDLPQVVAMREFLGALLLGEGAIQRYTAPGTDIAAITPPPFSELEVDEVAVVDPEADETTVRASVLAVDVNGLAQRLHYTVDLRLRDGRWEVVELHDAPPLDKERGVPAENTTDR